jgi:hypothetical protein
MYWMMRAVRAKKGTMHVEIRVIVAFGSVGRQSALFPSPGVARLRFE